MKEYHKEKVDFNKKVKDLVEEAHEGSKYKKKRLSSRVSLVVDNLKPSTRGPMIIPIGTFKGTGELFLSSLTDFHSLRVCVISTDGWAWYLEWINLGVESITSMPLYKLSGIQLRELGVKTDNVLEVSLVPNPVDIICGHVTKWTHLWS